MYLCPLKGGRRGWLRSGAAAPQDRSLGGRGGVESDRLQDRPRESRDPRQESGADVEVLAAARGGREAHRGTSQRGAASWSFRGVFLVVSPARLLCVVAVPFSAI